MSERVTRTWQMVPEFVKAIDEKGEVYLKVKDNMSFPKLVTINREKSQLNGTTVNAAFIKEDPNPAGQYIIRANAQFYDERCAAMERYASENYPGKLSEITQNKFTEGEMPEELKPRLPDSPEVAELKRKIAQLEAAQIDSNKKKKE